MNDENLQNPGHSTNPKIEIKNFNVIKETLYSQLFVLLILNLYIKIDNILFLYVSILIICYSLYFIYDTDITKEKNHFIVEMNRSKLVSFIVGLYTLTSCINICFSVIIYLSLIKKFIYFNYFFSTSFVPILIGVLLFMIFELIDKKYIVESIKLKNILKSTVFFIIISLDIIFSQIYDPKIYSMSGSLFYDMNLNNLILTFLTLFFLKLFKAFIKETKIKYRIITGLGTITTLSMIYISYWRILTTLKNQAFDL